jgi:hypothetical protein
LPRKGKGNISAEGQELLEVKDIWGNETVLHGTIYESRKRERSNEDGLFMSHQKGPITSTFTADWFLREGQGRELLGEGMKLTSVRSEDQRIVEDRFRTEKDLPEQTLGHIQHTCEALSPAHIDDHHHCW